jgi:proteic killer suppression protein
MIKTWKNERTRRVLETGSIRGFRGLDREKAENRLAALNVAKSLDDLGRLRSVGLHKLKGGRKGQWAMTINDRWRVCFGFREGDAYDVEITDYHKG